MSEQLIKAEIEGRILIITINRPDKKNALTVAMYAAMAEALRSASENAQVRAVLLTGADGAFTAGNDLIDFQQNPPAGPDAPVFQFMQAILNLTKPLIVAVNGMGVGIGLTMLPHADVVLMARSAFLSAPFVDLALVPEFGSSILLPRQIGHAMTSDIFLTGRRLTASEACECGLVSRVCDDNSIFDEAMKVAQIIAAKAPESVRLTRELVRKSYTEELETRINEENILFGKRLRSPEFMEAAMAFMEKRAPVFD
ncbi:enoyl-CoA hydratase [Kordiimonas sediminis]|uniref:Enoyl-CoA hydratase n=1 Tax=Kordiimonas sediminis TaxID=1735581 RepID=A0A919E7Y3_9PROT|nr:enoyl-CoA hydratase [Kordiimonas sediminis]GHF22705.1 enoyl-CoA hydratase [Kordiimonas sediminis]